LSHLPSHVNTSNTRLFILIYSPDVKQFPSGQNRPEESLTSSFSNIGHDDARTPGEEQDKPLSAVDPNPMALSSSGADTPRTPGLDGASASFNALYAEAQGLVEQDTMIMRFTTSSGHVHLLRSLEPDLVYLQESLSGENGDIVTHLLTFIREVVLVVGAEGGHGGLADSEDEGSLGGKGSHWWEQEGRTGLGKRLYVVEGMHIGDDWARRVEGHD
jgi:hypothetical protein